MKVFAPAKVNFGLSVLGVRPDGYHELHSVMVPLDIGDDLEVDEAGDLKLGVKGASLPEDEGNLVYRAARAYLTAAKVDGGARVTLHKRLPIASGMGGGSSDAASTLMALAKLYPSNVNLAGVALSLGADVPFFLLESAAVARGVGEQLAPIEVPTTPLVLVNPGVEVSARDAYRWLDEDEAFTEPLDVPALLRALSDGRDLAYFNALQGPVERRVPIIRVALDALVAAELSSPLMSGSGATCFALARSAEDARRAEAVLRERHPSWWVCACRTRTP
ncbi:4-(cytidine 5'-diphospho)-2-C-methyl-D-erythritol kinase [Deinococcus yavapaiensis]|uniref:4-diphosphocytidyl-2-C-methyl-D-erythritol kinase n=1 Tax=Deinococcus yavapaiensis KR-236 TaxID=694435 RepID=A0A318S5K9_9DEIO|nr:4-(cytidine 5'-diphospho)-2-C-methyl-D-erythritol kinase [Deinococcus yavapaiensis]PYE51093.1 4-diphosphocytidyl-2-C-methyl-D-erythritol kinase [Deinococcus yavapaiensis KR-236]